MSDMSIGTQQWRRGGAGGGEAKKAPIDKKRGAQTIALSGPSEAARASNPTQGSKMFNQAVSRGIRARNQALIRIGGEQGRAADLCCLLAGATARGLSWECSP